MADRSVSVPMTLGDLERPCVPIKGSNFTFQEDYVLITRTFLPRTRTTKCHRITQVHEEGVCISGHPRPTSQGAGPQRSPIMGFLSIYVYTL